MPNFKGFKQPGYSQIPNELFDEIQPVVSPGQFSILAYIARRTFGFHINEQSLGVGKISRGTGISESCVKECLRILCGDGYLSRRKVFDDSTKCWMPNVYGLRMDGDRDPHPGAESDPPPGAESDPPSGRIRPTPPAEFAPPLGQNLDPYIGTKETSKETNKESSENNHPPLLEETQTPYTPIDPESGEILKPDRGRWRRPTKTQMRKMAPPDPNSASERIRAMRENPRPEATEAARQAASASTQPGNPPAPTGASLAAPAIMPPEVAEWNEVVKHGSLVKEFSWDMEEGRHLRRCRDNIKFTTDRWSGICRHIESVLETDPEYGQHLKSFHWLIAKDDRWWKAVNLGYEHLKTKEPRPNVGRGKQPGFDGKAMLEKMRRGEL